jgi:hypothetical protein
MFGTIKVETLVLGLWLVGLGTLWTLANLGRLDLLETLRRWWPSLLVVWGALEIAAAALRRRAQDGGR